MHRRGQLGTVLLLIAAGAALSSAVHCNTFANEPQTTSSSLPSMDTATASDALTRLRVVPWHQVASVTWGHPARARNTRDPKSSVWRSQVLNMLAVGMGIGQLTGTADKQIALIDPNTVHVFSMDGTEMKPLATYRASPLELKSIDVAKTRKQGPARIYVTAQNRSSLASFVLELRNGTLVPVIQNIPYYLRIIEYPTKGPILLGQKKGITRTYEGPIMRLEDKGDELAPIGRFGVPLKIPIFGFCIGDLEGKRQPAIAVYDREEHLRLYQPSGKRFFLSQEYYGGSDVLLRQEESEGRLRGIVAEQTEQEYVRPRIMALNLDGKGAYDILTIVHESMTRRMLGRMKMYQDGQVLALAWNGDSLEEKWRSPKIQGMITDFAVDTLPVLPGPALITVERQKTDWLSFLSSKSQVRAYSLKDLKDRRLRPDKEEE